MSWLALDIGGANLKVADGRHYARSYPFPMWQQYRQLEETLRSVLDQSPECRRLAVTMTGELADCFEDRVVGVRSILQSVESVCHQHSAHFYRVDGRFVEIEEAAADPTAIASANWHALATYSAQLVGGQSALMIDIGSTTVDIVPLADGQPANRGATDYVRLVEGELVYTGVERSPVCAVVQTLPFHGERIAVAQELFATMRDVHLLLGHLPEDPSDHQTADGRPATRADAHRRLARVLCLDAHQLPGEVARQWSEQIAAAQIQLIAHAVRKVLSNCAASPSSIVITGHGRPVAQQLLATLSWSGPVVWLEDQLGEQISRCASAHALAVLARNQPDSVGPGGGP